MRILVTGGAGFIGSHLTERFLADGHHVLCIDNWITGCRENVQPFLKHPNYTLVEWDISKRYEPEGAIDYVLHFASPASPIDYLKYPIPTLKVGAIGTLNALGISKAKKAKFLLASTSETYGDPQVHPQPETYWGHVNPVGPRGVYDEAKRFAEAITMAYHRYHGLDTRIVRIFNTYGPRMRMHDGRAIPAFCAQALANEPITVFGDGLQTRSFGYISDLVEGITRLMAADYHDPINIGNPREMTLLELAKKIIVTTHSKSVIVHRDLPVDDPKVRRPDITRAREILNWEPKISLDEGLSRTIAWFKSVQ